MVVDQLAVNPVALKDVAELTAGAPGLTNVIMELELEDVPEAFTALTR